MSKRSSSLLSSTTKPYAINKQNITITNVNPGSNFDFQLTAYFSGAVLYIDGSEDSVVLYGGSSWARGNFPDIKLVTPTDPIYYWGPSMWPGQFAPISPTIQDGLPVPPGQNGLGGVSWQAGQPSCNPNPFKPQLNCKYSSTNNITTNPDLSKNTCCIPFFDIKDNVKGGKEVIFNSYYGFCFSGYSQSWDTCANKQIWISATPDYINTIKIGEYGIGDTLDTLNKKTMMSQATNTKDISYFSGSGSGSNPGNAGNWCDTTGGYDVLTCNVPSQNSTKYFNPPQNGDKVFPNVINTDTINWTVSPFGLDANPFPGCPNNSGSGTNGCKTPCGFIRWGQKLKAGANAPKDPCPGQVPKDNPDDWEVVKPGDQQPTISWMPMVEKRQVSYYPQIKDESSTDTNATISILGENYNFNSVYNTGGKVSVIDLCKWMGSITGSSMLPSSSKSYIAYGCLIHGVVCAIYNDWFSDDPPSGLTILNPVSDFLKLYFNSQYIWGDQPNTFKSLLIGTSEIKPIFTGSSKIWSNVVGKIDPQSPTPIINPQLLSNLIIAPKITMVDKTNYTYQIKFSQSIWQFKKYSESENIIDYFKNDTQDNYSELIALLNKYINTDVLPNYFGSSVVGSNESLSFNGKTVSGNNIQPLNVFMVGSKMSDIQMSFNCWNMKTGIQVQTPISAYDYINPNSNISPVPIDNNNSEYHAISINYTATIKQWSPMAVLYFAYQTGSTELELSINDDLCKYNLNAAPTIAPPIMCLNAFIESQPPRTKLLDVCDGGINGGGGFDYSPPLKKLVSPSNSPFLTSIEPAVIQNDITGANQISNYIFSISGTQLYCNCVQTRLNINNNSGDPTSGMCFSKTCNDPEVIKTFGLTTDVCKPYCETMCEKLKNGDIVNTSNFDPARFSQTCGFQCTGWRNSISKLNKDVVISATILVPMSILVFWLLTKNMSQHLRIILTVVVAITSITNAWFYAKLFNGQFFCGASPEGIQDGVTPGSCYLNWPFGGNPPSWFNNIKIDKSFCNGMKWWTRPCDCAACDPSSATCPGCGKDCVCIDQECINQNNPISSKKIIEVPKFNLTYLIAAILFSIFGIIIFNKLSNLPKKYNIIISALIIILPLVIWSILFTGYFNYITNQSKCS